MEWTVCSVHTVHLGRPEKLLTSDDLFFTKNLRYPLKTSRMCSRAGVDAVRHPIGDV